MVSDDAEGETFCSIESFTPGYSLDTNDALKVVFGENPADALDDVADAKYYAENPRVLAITLVKDFAKLVLAIDSGDTDQQYACNSFFWSFSPLMQSGRYYRLLSALIASCPFTFDVFVNLGEAWRSGNEVAIVKALEDAREEIAAFSLWVEIVFPTTNKPESDSSRLLPSTATSEDIWAFFQELQREGVRPTKQRLGAMVRSAGKTLASNTLQRIKKEIERQAGSHSVD